MTAPVIESSASVLDDLDALVPPAFWHCPDYVETIGPEAADLMALFGYVPNPEQRLLLDANFGMDRTGRLSAFEVFVLAARQNLKTGFLIQRATAKALLLRRPLQIWTAHKESATDQAFGAFARMMEDSAEFSKRVKHMPQGKGSKAIEFINGCTIVFRPRTGKAGQSMSADDVDMDEYFAVEAKHEGSLIPTLSTRPNAQIGKVSSAPHAGSNMQRTVMARGRSAALGLAYEPRLLYAEWSPMRHVGSTLAGRPRYEPLPCRAKKCTHELGQAGCIADDREVIKLTNPSVGRSAAPSITWDYVESERRSLANPDAPPDALAEWLKERLSVGVEDIEGSSSTLFGPAALWISGQIEDVPDGIGAIGLALSADRTWLGVTGASVVEYVPDDDPEAEPVERVAVAPILHTEDRTAVFELLQTLQAEHDCAIGIDEGGPAADLLDDLEELGLAIETLNLQKYAKASSKFNDRVNAKPDTTVLHLANAELDAHVGAAAWKWVGDRRVIARRDGEDVTDITLLEGAVIATALAEGGGVFNIG